MSLAVSRFYWEQCTDVKGSDRLVILALADYCNDSGWCFPSVSQLARHCQLSDRGAQKILARLARGGHIAVERNQGTRRTGGSPTHRYHLLAYQRGLGRARGEPMRSPIDTAKGEPTAQKGEQTARKGEQTARKGEPARSPEPNRSTNDPKTNNAPRARPAFPPAPSKPTAAAAAPAVPSDYQRVVKAYHDEIGTLTPIVEEEIKAELTHSSPDWVIRAIGLAALRDHRCWAYVAGILRRWHADGFDGGVNNRPARTPHGAQIAPKTSSKSTGYGRQQPPAVCAKGQSIEDYADDPEYYAQLKALYAAGSGGPGDPGGPGSDPVGGPAVELAAGIAAD